MNGSECRFRDRWFFLLCRAMEHIMICSIASFELYCTIGDYFSRYDSSFSSDQERL